jgi:LEA14-like dessication related protein
MSATTRLAAGTALCGVLFVAGCATMAAWANLQAPRVELERIQVRSIGLSSGTFDLTLRVDNPNQVDLEGTALTATIDVKGARFAQADLSQAFTLPKGAAVSLVIPVTLSWSGAGAVAREVLNSGSVPYSLGGRVTVNTPVGAKGLDFSGSGAVQVMR